VTSQVSGETRQLNVRRRIVDATYLSPTIPAKTPPPFGVADDVNVVAANELARLEAALQLELAEREFPRCDRCGEHTVPNGRQDGSVWLECVSLGTHTPALTRLLGVDFTGGHTRRLVLPAPARSGRQRTHHDRRSGRTGSGWSGLDVASAVPPCGSPRRRSAGQTIGGPDGGPDLIYRCLLSRHRSMIKALGLAGPSMAADLRFRSWRGD
jgi:hypothetical protein